MDVASQAHGIQGIIDDAFGDAPGEDQQVH